jgi:hypothetical protein
MFHERRCHASSCHDMRPISQQQATSCLSTRMSIPRCQTRFRRLVRPVHIDSKYKRSLYAPTRIRRDLGFGIRSGRFRRRCAKVTLPRAAAIKVDEGLREP